MAEQKKRGFHALEQRIHEMEEEDTKRERSGSSEGNVQAPRREPTEKPSDERKTK